jgi:RHS repeat-associated protein
MLQDSEDNTYVYGLDLISRTDGEDNQEYYLTDGLGSTTGLTDDTGDLIDEYQYDVFGAVRDHSGDSPNEFTFTGEQSDPTGLEFLRARYYDPATGRFLGRDPVPYIQRYAYAGSNPVNLTDPTGLSPTGNLTADAMEYAAICLAQYAGQMLDINEGNPCAAELAALNAAVQAMLEATLNDLQDTWNALPSPAQQCLTWGVGGFVGGGLGGAAVGCAAGGGLAIVDEFYGPSAITSCLAWGAAGQRISLNLGGALVGCATGIASYYLPESRAVQCMTWLIGSSSVQAAKGTGSVVRSGLGGCLSGALSVAAVAADSP